MCQTHRHTSSLSSIIWSLFQRSLSITKVGQSFTEMGLLFLPHILQKLCLPRQYTVDIVKKGERELHMYDFDITPSPWFGMVSLMVNLLVTKVTHSSTSIKMLLTFYLSYHVSLKGFFCRSWGVVSQSYSLKVKVWLHRLNIHSF